MTAPDHTRTDAPIDNQGRGDGTRSDRPGRSLLRNIGRGLVILVVACSFAVWVYAYSGAAKRDAPDLLSDASFPTAAEEICAAAVVDVEAMPNALDAVDGPDRGRQIRRTTARYEQMLDGLDPLVEGSASDVEIAAGWLSDWRVMIDDRYRYADAIAEDDSSQFFITDVGVAERLDRRLTRVANTNNMSSCAAPTDVG